MMKLYESHDIIFGSTRLIKPSRLRMRLLLFSDGLLFRCFPVRARSYPNGHRCSSFSSLFFNNQRTLINVIELHICEPLDRSTEAGLGSQRKFAGSTPAVGANLPLVALRRSGRIHPAHCVGPVRCAGRSADLDVRLGYK